MPQSARETPGDPSLRTHMTTTNRNTRPRPAAPRKAAVRNPRRPDPRDLPDPRTLPWQQPPAAAPDPRAAAGWAAELPEASTVERRVVEAQIGRGVRGSVAVAARCRYGLPLAVRTAPRLEDGTPFPTLYWLSCPAARAAVGRLEAAGWNALLTERVAGEPELAAAQQAAYERYVAQRDAVGGPLPGAPGAGGLPGRVKCLHALYADEVATGDDPAGRIARRVVDPVDCPGPCVDGVDPDQTGPAG
jgi:uncharacterized protein